MIWAGFVQSILCRSIEIKEKASGWCGEAYENVAFPLPVEAGGKEDFGEGRAVLERRRFCWWK
jgi:hypothetical protein